MGRMGHMGNSITSASDLSKQKLIEVRQLQNISQLRYQQFQPQV